MTKPMMIALEPGLAINPNHIVWVKKEKDGSISLHMAAPGPGGKSLYNTKEPVALANINRWLGDED